MVGIGRFANWLLVSGTSLALLAGCTAGEETQGSPSGGYAGAGEATGGAGQTGGTTGTGGGLSGGAGGSLTGGSGGDSAGGAGGTGGSLTGGTGGGLSGGTGGGVTGGVGGDLTGGVGGGGTGGEPSGGTGGDATGGTAGTGGDSVGGTGGDQPGGAGGTSGSGGDAGSAGSGGQQTDPFEGTVVPTNVGSSYSLTFGETVFTVDASQAGRITTYSIGGENVLVTSASSTGSVFWPSPQDLFPDRWPPPVEFDSAAYSASLDGNVIVMSSTSDWSAGGTLLGVTKRFWANAENEVVTIEYTIHNNGSAAMSVAPWEVTRVFTGGLTLAAEEPAATRYSYADSGAIPFTSELGTAWFLYQAATVPGGNVKTGLDASEGWAAHLHCGSPGLERTCTGSDVPILIKHFDNVLESDFAPDQAEVEVYTNGEYVEFEIQGAYMSIPAGGDYTWTVHWYLRTLPTDVTPETESAALLSFVQGELL